MSERRRLIDFGLILRELAFERRVLAVGEGVLGFFFFFLVKI